ncbi:MAG: acyl carrier protein [Alphaproteobacteria bacterium]|nr:acyl carrier protein [Alphaproteobacteria bacterium]
MEKDYVFEKLQGILHEKFGLLPSTVTPESRLVEDLGLDSLDYVNLILLIEEEFNCSIPDEEVEQIKTINDLICIIPT